MTGCSSCEAVTFQIYRNPPVGDPATITADLDGTAAATTFPIPDAPGDYNMVCTGGQGCAGRYDFKVAVLSATGSNSLTLITGLGLLAITSLRRRPQSASAVPSAA